MKEMKRKIAWLLAVTLCLSNPMFIQAADVEAVVAEDETSEDEQDIYTVEETEDVPADTPEDVLEEQEVIQDFERVGKSYSGTCDGGAAWRIEENAGGSVLIISGEGTVFSADAEGNKASQWAADFADSLTGIVVESGVTAIGDYAFCGLEKVRTVQISDSVVSIGKWAFADCSGLKDVQIPKRLESIGYFAFGRCKALEDIELPDTLKTMEGSEFSGCASLRWVEIPEGIKTLLSTFEYCQNLEEVILPGTLTDISRFDGCLKLSSIVIREGNTPFYTDESGLYRRDASRTSLIYCYPTGRGEYRVDDQVNRIEPGAFSCTGYSKITIPGSVTTVNELFGGQDYKSEPLNPAGLEIVLERGVLEIGSHAFDTGYEGVVLKKVIIPRSVVSIKEDAFGIKASSTKLCCYEDSEAYRFGKMKGMKIELLTGGESIRVKLDAGEGTVSPSALTVYIDSAVGTLPEPVRSGWNFAGWYTRDGRWISPGSIVSDDMDTLYARWSGGNVYQGDCGETTQWLLDEETGVLRIAGTGSAKKLALGGNGNKAARLVAEEGITELSCPLNETRITTASLPNTLKNIWGSFSGCRYLTELTIPEGVLYIGSFAGCSSLRRLELPASLGEIEETNPAAEITEGMFCGCSSLEEIVIDPANPKYSADAYAIYTDKGKTLERFYNHKAEKFTVPGSVQKIGARSFLDETLSLRELEIPANVTEIEDGCISDRTIIIDCYSGSAAHRYAQGRHIFRLLDAASGVLKFDAGAGSCAESQRTLSKGSCIGTLPEAVSSSGYFAGWFSAPSGGTRITEYTQFTGDMTIYARWVNADRQITLDAAGGLMPSGAKVDYRFLEDGEALGMLPQPYRDGYAFRGWYTQKDGGERFEEGTVPKTDILYAQWKKKIRVEIILQPENGGDRQEFWRLLGEPFGALPTPVKDNYIFDGWWSAKSGGTELTATAVVENEATYYAHWTKVKASYKVVFDANGGSVSPAQMAVVPGKAYGTLPVPTRKGYKFTGWYTAQNGGTRVLADYMAGEAKSQTLYAHWEGNTYTVTFNPNGGQTGTKSKSVINGEVYGALPDASRKGYTFQGWYSKKSGGTKITSVTKVNLGGSQTLYAQWEKDVTTADAYSLESLSYSFSNSNSAFGYSSSYRIPLKRYQQFFSAADASALYRSQGIWGGNCFGMATTSSMLATSGNDLSPSMFGRSGVSGLKVKDRSTALQMNVTEMIECMQVAQSAYNIQRTQQRNSNQLDDLCQIVKKVGSTERPVKIGIYSRNYGHAVLGYDFEEVDSKTGRIYVYDCNYPLEKRYIKVGKNSSGQYTSIGYNIGTESVTSMNYLPYENYYEIWTGRSYTENTNLLYLNVANARILDNSGKLAAEVKDGELETSREDICQFQPESITADGDSTSMEGVLLYLPTDTYTVQNTDVVTRELQAEMANNELGAQVKTTADMVTLSVDGSQSINEVTLPSEKGEKFEINLQSAMEMDNETVELTGVSEKETVSLSQSEGTVIPKAENARLMINGVEQAYATITAKSGSGGSISPKGTADFKPGSFQQYKITPKSGYAVKDVKVDNVSVGAVNKYSFSDIRYPHTISAEFVKITTPKTPKLQAASSAYNQITLKWNKVSGATGYQLQYSTAKNGKYKTLKNVSSNTSTFKAGNLTTGKTYYFRIRAYNKLGSKNYYSSYSAAVSQAPKPGTVSVTSLKSAGSTKAKITWKKVSGASGYEILYSTDSKFKKNYERTPVSGGKTVTKTISRKAGKTGYYKVRAYRSVNGRKVYGAYSKVKKLK